MPGIIAASVKRGERRYVTAALVIVSLAGALTAFANSGAKIVYKIKYSGKDIAIVENKKSFDVAKQTVVKMVSGSNVEKAVAAPEYRTVVALTPDINNENDLVNAIIENTEEIVFGYSFVVNGEERFAADKETLDSCVDNYFEKFRIDNKICRYEFVEKTECRSGYFLKSDVLDAAEINYALNDLSVKTVAEEYTEIETPYKTVEIKDSNLLLGERKVMIEGKKGLQKQITTTEYINGKPTGEVKTDVKVVSEPVNEAVNIGTAIPDYQKSVATVDESGYVFPLPSGRWQVSAYFGDGRNHKGVDLASKTGTPIMAVASGKVVRSEWYDGYGYCVDINHGGGFITRYAHASELIANVGDEVDAGEVVALVGSTGNSTGSHLHIEFILNDNRLDPATYLGIY